MAKLVCNVISYTLQRTVDITVIVPSVTIPESMQMKMPGAEEPVKPTHQIKEKYPVLYLLHGFGNNHAQWSGYTSLELYAEERNIAVVMISGEHKFYHDTLDGDAFFDFVAKWLNMPVVAEGVERIEQVEFLRSIGCEYVQGYYFAKPMPVEEYEKLQFDRPHSQREKDTERLVDIDSLWMPASQLETLFLNAKQGVAVYEYSKDQIETIRVNNAYYEMFGYQDISQKKDIFQEIPKRYHKRVLDAFSHTADTGHETQCEFSKKNEAGEEFYIFLKLYDVGIVGNKHIIYGVFLNVTEPKQLEWELEKYRLLLSGKRKSGEREQTKEQSEE